MNAPKETLAVRPASALDAGIDGITLAAGLHLGSFALIEHHPRFRDAKLGIIVSSLRALRLFLKKNARLNRLPTTWWSKARWPAGTWASAWTGRSTTWPPSSPRSARLAQEQLDIPLIPAGGIFTGGDAVRFMGGRRRRGAGGDALHRHARCGLPDEVKQGYFKADEDDIEVNQISPTGYPMRMIKASPGIGDGIRPNCEAYGYLLDANGKCAYITAWNREVAAPRTPSACR